MKTKAQNTAVSMRVVIPGRLARAEPETMNTGFDKAGEGLCP